jgi:hypothetical protein
MAKRHSIPSRRDAPPSWLGGVTGAAMARSRMGLTDTSNRPEGMLTTTGIRGYRVLAGAPDEGHDTWRFEAPIFERDGHCLLTLSQEDSACSPAQHFKP